MTICLNRSVLEFMASVLTRDSFVLEFGAGGSTRWFADRCGRLVSVETSREWAERVRDDLTGADCKYCVLLTDDPSVSVSVVADPSSADLALIDGVWTGRDACARLAWPLIKSGGWLVFDDAQRERHAGTIAWLNQFGEAKPLRWSPGDVEPARDRLALAWQKP